jgi:glyoxylase-like metal-dependent hydrolase (beta-lactamase superfamily II)
MRHLALGNVNISRVIEMEGGAAIKPQQLLPDATSEVIESHRHWLMPHFLTAEGMLTGSIHTYVIHTRYHTILVDTCVGNDKTRSFPGCNQMQGPYLKTLEQVAGIKPEQVDYVLCTHFNVDHVGWNTRLMSGKWVPTFPNAKYLFALKEWEFWKHKWDKDKNTEDGSIADSVIPVIEARKAVLVECDHIIDDQVFLEPTPGHTPGHVCVHIKGGGREAIMSGDIMHHPVQTAEPQWNSSFCIDPKEAAATRRMFLERNADTGRLILAAHFPTPTVGTIVASGNSFRFKVAALPS